MVPKAELGASRVLTCPSLYAEKAEKLQLWLNISGDLQHDSALETRVVFVADAQLSWYIRKNKCPGDAGNVPGRGPDE